MNKMFLLIFIFLGQISGALFGLEVKRCYIKDAEQHAFNQEILRSILEQEIVDETPLDPATHLSARITQIAHALLCQGFRADAYEIPEVNHNTLLSFAAFTLWEGEKNGIPLTFFVYVWPSEELALRYHPLDPLNCRYASNTHSHPIPCAFAVLQGVLVQNNYERVTSHDRVVRFVGEETFLEGQGDVDDLTKPFIHKLYNKGTDSKMSVSLHAYSLSSAEKVRACFQATQAECSYDSLL